MKNMKRVKELPATKDEFIRVVGLGKISDLKKKEKFISVSNLNKIWELGLEIDFILCTFEEFSDIIKLKEIC